MKKNVFLTGITGFLGSFLAVELLKKGYRVIGLARSKRGKSAHDRVYDAVKFASYEDEWDEALVKSNLEVVEGDIEKKYLGLSEKNQKSLSLMVTDIFHCAALAELNLPYEEIKKPNVDGTKNTLDLAMSFKDSKVFKKFHHVSTMYVCGDHQGVFDESMLDVGQKFNNSYEQSKFEAEKLVHEYKRKGLSASIYRPSMIMGDSRTGKTNNFKLFYQPLRHFVKGYFKKYPADVNCKQNLINIDTVAKMIAFFAEKKVGTYHVLSPRSSTIKNFVQIAEEYFNCAMPKFVPRAQFDFDKLTPVQRALCVPFSAYFDNRYSFKGNASRLDGLEEVIPTSISRANFERVFAYFKKHTLK